MINPAVVRVFVITVSLGLAACGSGGGGGGNEASSLPGGPVSISGTLNVASFNTVDGDVNDPAAAYTPNDNLSQAQNLPNPATVGGFASASPTGSPGGRFEFLPDRADFYRVTLAANQHISLFIGGHPGGTENTPDLDLELFNTDGNRITSSDGQGPSESLTVSAAGTYTIGVKAVAGATNYILSIGQGPAETSSLDADTEFVPGEIIVRFKEGAGAAGRTRAAALGFTPLSGGEHEAVLIRMETGIKRKQVFRSLGIRENADTTSRQLEQQSAHKSDTIRAVLALRQRPDVSAADLNYIRRPAAVPNDAFYLRQWHYPLIRLPQAWDITTGTPATGQVIVAVIDSGIARNHSDLEDKRVAGYDFIKDPDNAMDNTGIDSDPTDPGDSLGSFHGTHVAGTVAAASNNNIGVSGVSWGARIMPLRVLGARGGTSYDIIQAVRYAARLPNDSGTLPAQRADIINLSLAGGGYSQSEQNAYTAARNQGVIIIAAAGNKNTSLPSYPASYNGVISVSAVGLNSAKAFYSNFGAAIDVAAPGGDMSADVNGDGFPDGILSTLMTLNPDSESLMETYSYFQGTSMAAPHVAGVAALMKAIHPGLTPAQFDAALTGNAITRDLGNAGRDDIFGQGLIDALQAVQHAQSLAGEILPPMLAVTPTAIHFELTRGVKTLEAENGGGGTLMNVSATDDADWLTVTGSGLGTYTVSINDADLGPGVHSAKITFSGSANSIPQSVTVPVTLQVGGAGTGNAGLHYVLLVDSASGEAVQSTTADPGDGYRFNLDGVAPGSYFVVAGSDMDNNHSICGPGEACGGYPTLDAPSTLSIGDTSISGIDFTTGFVPTLGTHAIQTVPQRGFARSR